MAENERRQQEDPQGLAKKVGAIASGAFFM